MLQLATPNLAGFTKSYIAPPVPVTYVGKRVEADYFEAEFNEEVVIDRVNKDGLIIKQTHVKKLASHGNALACFDALRKSAWEISTKYERCNRPCKVCR